MMEKKMHYAAIACVLINTPEATPICATKNICVCGDCHFATLLTSRMEKCRIEVKNAHCIHIFEDESVSVRSIGDVGAIAEFSLLLQTLLPR
eukprot:c25308_g8_i1 orf=380-655(-)